jgi:hypothetical protein
MLVALTEVMFALLLDEPQEGPIASVLNPSVVAALIARSVVMFIVSAPCEVVS